MSTKTEGFFFLAALPIRSKGGTGLGGGGRGGGGGGILVGADGAGSHILGDAGERVGRPPGAVTKGWEGGRAHKGGVDAAGIARNFGDYCSGWSCGRGRNHYSSSHGRPRLEDQPVVAAITHVVGGVGQQAVIAAYRAGIRLDVGPRKGGAETHWFSFPNTHLHREREMPSRGAQSVSRAASVAQACGTLLPAKFTHRTGKALSNVDFI